MSNNPTPRRKKSQDEPHQPKLSETALTPERLALFLEFLEQDDLSLVYDIRLLGADGEVFQIKGNSSFPAAMRQENKSVIPQQFQEVVQNSMLLPLFRRFHDYVQENVQNILPRPPLPMFESELGLALDVDRMNEDDAAADTRADQGVIP
jgi:hypothetical protein